MAAAMRTGALGPAAPTVSRPLPCLRLPTVPRATTTTTASSSTSRTRGGGAAGAGGAGGARARGAAAAAAAFSPARRMLLRGGGAVLLGLAGAAAASAAPPRDVRAAVFQQVSVEVQATLGGPDEDDAPAEDPPTYVKATGRIVAIGDLHGDLAKTIRSLQLARVLSMGPDGRTPTWVGGDTVVVQLGDVLDRGDDEIAILRLLYGLHAQAVEQGGALYMLNGNHESLNVCGDFRYVTPGAFVESAEEFGIPREAALCNWEGCIQARASLYLPGGKVARMLARNPTVLIVNDTAFAHGGLLPTHAAYGLERMNSEVAAWMRRDRLPADEEDEEGGFAAPPFLAMGDANSVMWNRTLGREAFPSPIDRIHACNAVTQALERVGAKRLVVGHTPQMRGVNCECDGKVWRVDVGMSSGVLDAPVAVLEILPAAAAEGDGNGSGSGGPARQQAAPLCRIVTEESAAASLDEEGVEVDL